MQPGHEPNPFAPPRVAVVEEAARDRRSRVLAAAEGQRHINVLILASMAMVGFVLLKPLGGTTGAVITIITSLVQLAYIIAVALIVFRTTRILHGTFRAVVYALFSIVPLINLLLLLSISSTATKMLKTNGFKVGLLGADLEEVRRWAGQSRPA